MLVHLLALDGIEHKTGFGNDAGRNTIAFLDDRVKDIIEGVREAGDLDRTTFLIVSDHGQQSVFKHVNGSALLRRAGLQGSSGHSPAFCIPEGGFALIYQRDATPESTKALKSAFLGQPGIRAVLTPAEAAKEGLPTPSDADQGPDLLVYAANGFAFADDASAEIVTETKEVGAHGYPNTEPLMKAIFIASGAGIAKKGEIPEFDNVDVAPTIAHLLRLHLEDISGKELTAIVAKPGRD